MHDLWQGGLKCRLHKVRDVGKAQAGCEKKSCDLHRTGAKYFIDHEINPG